MYEPRTYRQSCQSEDLASFSIEYKETDLFILAESLLQDKALQAVLDSRLMIEEYIQSNSFFLTSLSPLPADTGAPPLVFEMLKASCEAKVGPMAAVAGAIAEFVGRRLLCYSSQVIVENGGDIFLASRKKRLIKIFAGQSPFSDKIGLEIESFQTPLGICTSSGTVGHSLSFGQADAVVVLARSTSLADAMATAIGNMIKTKEDIPAALEQTKNFRGLLGVVVIKDDQAGFWGKITLRKVF